MLSLNVSNTGLGQFYMVNILTLNQHHKVNIKTVLQIMTEGGWFLLNQEHQLSLLKIKRWLKTMLKTVVKTITSKKNTTLLTNLLEKIKFQSTFKTPFSQGCLTE